MWQEEVARVQERLRLFKMFSKGGFPTAAPSTQVLTEQLLQGSLKGWNAASDAEQADTLLISWPLSCPKPAAGRGQGDLHH